MGEVKFSFTAFIIDFYLDPGCLITIANRETIKSQFLNFDLIILKSLSPIPIIGVGNFESTFTDYIKVDLFLPGRKNIKENAVPVLNRIPVEIYLVNNLLTNLLLAINIITPNLIIFDFAN